MVELITKLKVVEEICGHASQATTEKYYEVRSREGRLRVERAGSGP